jgi:hypothetical protein
MDYSQQLEHLTVKYSASSAGSDSTKPSQTLQNKSIIYLPTFHEDQ